MFVLPSGVTGFRQNHDILLPLCDIPRFKGHVFVASGAVGGRVLSFREPGADRNYAEAVIETPDGIIAVLLNRHYPIIAFASLAGDGEMVRRFVEAHDLTAAFEDLSEYQLLPRSVAEEPINPEVFRSLEPAELAQIAYWQPDTVGEVIFNSWD